mmetsp:Transcript_3469/g.8064  ORF Transcript_3469/g.8064 Transcript_3469/m.8064 type:complete len:192 (+) Transcript_3469:312-887(+)
MFFSSSAFSRLTQLLPPPDRAAAAAFEKTGPTAEEEAAVEEELAFARAEPCPSWAVARVRLLGCDAAPLRECTSPFAVLAACSVGTSKTLPTLEAVAGLAPAPDVNFDRAEADEDGEGDAGTAIMGAPALCGDAETSAVRAKTSGPGDDLVRGLAAAGPCALLLAGCLGDEDPPVRNFHLHSSTQSMNDSA